MSDHGHDPRLPAEMQQVKLDPDGIPHNIGWMHAASQDELHRQFNRADDAWQHAMKTRPGPDRGTRELWWMDRVDEENKRRAGWSEPQLQRLDEHLTTRRERENDPGLPGRMYRALYRLRDNWDVARDIDPTDRYGPPTGRSRDQRER